MQKIKINSYILKNPKIKEKKVILNISDIHSNIKALDKILSFLETTKVDYILIPGDSVDIINKDKENIFLEKLIKLGNYAKTYISLGNHDKYVKDKKVIALDDNSFISTNYYNTLKKANNIFFLTDDFNLNKEGYLTISAINFPNNYYSNKENKSDFNNYILELDKKYKLDSKDFNIILIHSPNCLIKKKKIIENSKIIDNSNLIVCGHNHGGLTPTWIQDLFNNHYGLVGPFNKFLQKCAYGIYTNNNKNLLISNGITKLSDMARFKFMHSLVNKILLPEVDLIYLENDNTNSFKLVDRSKYE